MRAGLFCLIGALLGAGNVWAEENSLQQLVRIIPDPFVYRAEDRRNPFLPPIAWLAHFAANVPTADAAVTASQRLNVRTKELLESFQMDSLKLVAIILLEQNEANSQTSTAPTNESVAMVEDPEGVGHLVRVGSYMGVHEGRIIQISEGKVMIEEPAPKLGDPTAVRITTLELHKTEEPGRDNVSTKTKN